LEQILRSTALRLSAVLWVFGYVLVEVAAVAMGRSPPGQMFLANLPLLALGIAQSVALGRLLDRLGGRPWVLRWPLMAFAGVLAGVVQTVADDTWLRTLSLTLIPEWQAWAAPFQPQRLFLVFMLYAWTIFLNIALVWAARSADQARVNEARAAAFEAAALRAEAAALRLQLNPHFLFNTLNGIASLVVRGRHAEAEEMIGRLADFLRASLAADATALVPLHQELETISAYLDIEAARFGDRLNTEVVLPPELAALEVPNFILQPLVENAIKHGAARTRRATTITIGGRTEGGQAILSVVNRASGAAEPEAATPDEPAQARQGIGISNTCQRLAVHYGQAAWLQRRPLADGWRVEIGIPLPAPMESAA
jgi:hypothetical protein